MLGLARGRQRGAAQQPHRAAATAAPRRRRRRRSPPRRLPAGVELPPGDYVIGPDDILSVVFWRDKEMSADVVVRPDGRITCRW